MQVRKLERWRNYNNARKDSATRVYYQYLVSVSSERPGESFVPFIDVDQGIFLKARTLVRLVANWLDVRRQGGG